MLELHKSDMGLIPGSGRSPGIGNGRESEKLSSQSRGLRLRFRLCPFTVGGMGLIPGQGTKILHATQLVKKKKKKPGSHMYFYTNLM